MLLNGCVCVLSSLVPVVLIMWLPEVQTCVCVCVSVCVLVHECACAFLFMCMCALCVCVCVCVCECLCACVCMCVCECVCVCVRACVFHVSYYRWSMSCCRALERRVSSGTCQLDSA